MGTYQIICDVYNSAINIAETGYYNFEIYPPTLQTVDIKNLYPKSNDRTLLRITFTPPATLNAATNFIVINFPYTNNLGHNLEFASNGVNGDELPFYASSYISFRFIAKIRWV